MYQDALREGLMSVSIYFDTETWQDIIEINTE